MMQREKTETAQSTKSRVTSAFVKGRGGENRSDRTPARTKTGSRSPRFGLGSSFLLFFSWRVTRRSLMSETFSGAPSATSSPFSTKQRTWARECPTDPRTPRRRQPFGRPVSPFQTRRRAPASTGKKETRVSNILTKRRDYGKHHLDRLHRELGHRRVDSSRSRRNSNSSTQSDLGKVNAKQASSLVQEYASLDAAEKKKRRTRQRPEERPLSEDRNWDEAVPPVALFYPFVATFHRERWQWDGMALHIEPLPCDSGFPSCPFCVSM